MNNTKIIFTKELRSYFNSPMAYIFLIVFAITNGYFFTNTFFLFNQSDMRALFSIVPLIYLFFIPAVTMSLIAKEKNSGTMEVISTMPIKDVEFILGKFFAALTLICSGLVITFVHLFTLMNVGTNIDFGSVFTGYLGILLLGAVYASIGTFASSVTDNQVISFIISVFIVLLFFLMDKVIFFMPSSIQSLVQYISVEFHLSNMSRGVIDTRNIIYFISLIIFFLFMTTRVLEIRKWK